MVSLDSPEKNREFAESLGAEHVVLSDPLGDVARAYGVADAGGSYARRWTFYIDSGGTVRHVDREVATATAGRDIARNLERLGFSKAE